MTLFSQVEAFLQQYCPSTDPLLLALSGGADSLCLFYCLLDYRARHEIPFHIAHVDHGWRRESQDEVRILQDLAIQHHVPFHLKTLDPTTLKGNLEAACREERYAFFSELCQEYCFQGVLTGHHKNDQSETIFKRLLEGAHWSRLGGLKPESTINGMRVLRPMLSLSRHDIKFYLEQHSIQAFDDPTNRDSKFLRARLRENVFPWLDGVFGKKCEMNLIKIGEDTQELVDYFDRKLAPLLNTIQIGPWGLLLDMQSTLPDTLLEIKYLLRLLCSKQGFYLSHQIIEQAANALFEGLANRMYEMGSRQIRIDRKCLFIIESFGGDKQPLSVPLSPGSICAGDWNVLVECDIFSSSHANSSWKEGWQGNLRGYLPAGEYILETPLEKLSNLPAIKRKWSSAKIPAFLYDAFPLVRQGSVICHEFLTGNSLFQLKNGDRCWRVTIGKLKVDNEFSM